MVEFVYGAHIGHDPDGGYLVTFPDVPEAITHGQDVAEAKANAAEALGLSLRGYLAQGLPLPQPLAVGEGIIQVPVEANDAIKIAVIEAFRQAGISKSEFARRLGKAETEAYRVLDPDHATKLASLEAALAVFGKQVVVSIQDAA